MGVGTTAAQLAIVVLMTVASAHLAQAELSPGPGCSGSLVDSDRPEAGPACTSIINDPKAAPATRVDALLLRGLWHYRARRLDQAKQDIEHGLKLAPEHAKLLQLLASLHADIEDDEKAEQLAKHSAEIDPNRATTFEILAHVARRKGNVREALGYINRAVELRPEHAYFRYTRAQLLLKLNRATEALSDTSWLISQTAADVERAGGTEWIDGRHVRLHLASMIAHAQVLQALDRFEEAESQFNAIVSQKKNAFTLTQRSHFLHGLPIGAGMKSRLQEAMADAKEAVGFDPRDARARRQYASTLEYAKRPAEAIAEIDIALSLEQHDEGIPPLLWNRARLLRDLGRQDEAIESARTSLLIAQVAAPGYFRERIRRLEGLGYWKAPSSFPDTSEAALSNAVTACMVDESCW